MMRGCRVSASKKIHNASVSTRIMIFSFFAPRFVAHKGSIARSFAPGAEDVARQKACALVRHDRRGQCGARETPVSRIGSTRTYRRTRRVKQAGDRTRGRSRAGTG